MVHRPCRPSRACRNIACPRVRLVDSVERGNQGSTWTGRVCPSILTLPSPSFSTPFPFCTARKGRTVPIDPPWSRSTLSPTIRELIHRSKDDRSLLRPLLTTYPST